MIKLIKILPYILIIISTSCGYKIVGYNSKYPTLFYISEVTSNSIDTRFQTIAQETLNRYFVNYGEMTSYKYAIYILTAIIENIKFQTGIVSSTDEALTSDAYISLLIIINDKNGKEVFSKTYKTYTSYTVTPNISGTLMNQNNAIQDSIRKALDDFRNDFNASIAK